MVIQALLPAFGTGQARVDQISGDFNHSCQDRNQIKLLVISNGIDGGLLIWYVLLIGILGCISLSSTFIIVQTANLWFWTRKLI